MSKVAIKHMEFYCGANAYLWKDDEDGELSVEIETPGMGILESEDIAALIKFLNAVKTKMVKANQ